MLNPKHASLTMCVIDIFRGKVPSPLTPDFIGVCVVVFSSDQHELNMNRENFFKNVFALESTKY